MPRLAPVMNTDFGANAIVDDEMQPASNCTERGPGCLWYVKGTHSAGAAVVVSEPAQGSDAVEGLFCLLGQAIHAEHDAP